LIRDAVAQGGTVACGGRPIAGDGFFFEPTVLVNVPSSARIMNEEPFGPVAVVNSFSHLEDALSEANRLPYALAAYAWTTNVKTIATLKRRVRAGMLSVNHNGLGYPELPFGGILDSGFGDEGGLEAMREMMFTRLVTLSEA
jgi:succinate-semialdehyde dehydrogenase/glutarate-semialdehyde dehydrogenase